MANIETWLEVNHLTSTRRPMLGVTLMFSPEEITEVSKLDGVRAKIEDFQPDHIDQIDYRSADSIFVQANKDDLVN